MSIGISSQTSHTSMAAGREDEIKRETDDGLGEQSVGLGSYGHQVVSRAQLGQSAAGLHQNSNSHHQQVTANDIDDGNFIHDFLGINSHIDMEQHDQQQTDHQQQQNQQHHVQQQPGQEQMYEIHTQGGYGTGQDGNHKVILVSELFKCEICNVAFIFKEHYIAHCDDHIRMVAEHINLSGIVPINNFDEANQVLDFRNSGESSNNSQGSSSDHNQQQQQQLHSQMVGLQEDAVMGNGGIGVAGSGGGIVGGGGGAGGMVIDDEEEKAAAGGVGQVPVIASSVNEWCKCLLCDFKFKTPLSLSRHLNAHNENRNKCVKCNKFFTSYVSLRSHMRMHETEENLEMLEHNNNHNNNNSADETNGGAPKMYKCKKCNVHFGTANLYRDHKLTHSNDVYTCNECQLKFLSIINLNRHRQNEHQQRQTFICVPCSCEFTNRNFLDEHNKTRSHLHRKSSTAQASPSSSSSSSAAINHHTSNNISNSNHNSTATATSDVVVID